MEALPSEVKRTFAVVPTVPLKTTLGLGLRSARLAVIESWAYKIRSSLRSAAAQLRFVSTRANPPSVAQQGPSLDSHTTTR